VVRSTKAIAPSRAALAIKPTVRVVTVALAGARTAAT
jgi:hypothetical protein|tara:strand:- start:2843 stop:2953 length:111 start_codon:yes stop_codon:yes gene_type:complete